MKKSKKFCLYKTNIFQISSLIISLYFVIFLASSSFAMDDGQQSNFLKPWTWFGNDVLDEKQTPKANDSINIVTPSATPTEIPTKTPTPIPTKSEYEIQKEETDRIMRETNQKIIEGLQTKIKQIDGKIAELNKSINFQKNTIEMLLKERSAITSTINVPKTITTEQGDVFPVNPQIQWDAEENYRNLINSNIFQAESKIRYYENQINQLNLEKSQIMVSILNYTK